ncbi:MAG: bifunctional [glutamate--ammonia ligase]-adenylyl-L-tyrosine phosphorylase/[glutamate--ammonia-ligase] adenylyltransferase [Thalassotalea sp.]
MLFECELLNNQSEKAWQYLSENFPEYTATLNEQSQQQCQKSIALSDFIYKSLAKAPALIFPLFQSSNLQASMFPAPPQYSEDLAELLKSCDSEACLYRSLRQFRTQEMAKLAIADMLQNLPLEQSLAYLSELADSLILAALAWLSNFCYQQWGTPTNTAGETMPLLVFAMGKLGGKELNFSSDIDLIFSYPERGETVGARRAIDNQQFFVRLGQKLIAALDQITADGFVYRVDMRLRPFGESGPLVMNFSAFEDYYQEQGRDWERYAMLKARLIGNSAYHQQLKTLLKPFVYRRYIDFSVIDSLRKMKQMIAQEVRRKQLKNNIKLGAGGIREIEFIVQVFQLIRGGREPSLQQRNLLTVLPLLAQHGEIDQQSYLELNHAYCFLRRLENLIQALDDQQTQTLPDDKLNQARLINVLAYDSWQGLLTDVEKHMLAVHNVFDKLIGEAAPNNQAQDEHWQALLIAQWPKEECATYIEQQVVLWSGTQVWQLLTDFKQEMNKRSLGPRGRNVLEKLLPLILWHLENSEANEQVMERVMHIIKCIATRTAYLELLFENEGALKHLIKLCAASSWLAEHIAKYPILLDELIDPKLLHNPPELSQYSLDLRQIMLRVPADDLEQQMNTLRQFKQAQQLRIAAADISGVLPLMKVSDHLTALAEGILAEVIHIAWQQVTVKHGQPSSLAGKDDKGFLVLGYGKVGGLELGYSSDLDLVFVHGSDINEQTDGEKVISAGHFYIKLGQKMMHIFNTRMSSGILYELDLRLRPQGNSGLLMINIESFLKYQQQEAWTWEHQALVRARPINGSQALVKQFYEIRKIILSQVRENKTLLADVLAMRKKMRDHLDKSTAEFFDLKQGQGGLVDIEFLAQYLILNYAHQYPNIITYSDNIRMFERLAENKIILTTEAQTLIESYCQLRDEGHRLSLQAEQALPLQTDFAELTKQITDIFNKYLSADE